MSATLTRQLYSQNHWADIDGVQTIWNFTFAGGYIFPEHVKAYYLDDTGEKVTVIVTDDMLIGPYQLQVTPPIPASATKFVIYRDTPKDIPLVDFEGGAVVTEANLDRAAKQAIFVAAEAIDGSYADTGLLEVLERLALMDEELGFKNLKRNTYTGSSVVLAADRGRSHFKTDGTAVAVPNTLALEFLCTIVNYSASDMTVTFTDGTARMQGAADSDAYATWSLSAWNTLNIWKAADGGWLISGKATGS